MAQINLNEVQSELAARVAAIDARSRVAKPCEIARAVDEVRSIARANGLFPAVTVAQALEAALSRGEHGALIQGWLAVLRDAVGSERTDRPACEAYAAACSVRFYN